MKFKDWTHENFELSRDLIVNIGIKTHHAILYDDLAYFEIIFEDFNKDYELDGYYPVDLESFQKNEDPKIFINRPTTILEDDGSEYFDDNEIVFVGTLKDAQKDSRFADLEIEENVRSDYMPCDWATNSQYEKRFSKCKDFVNTYDNVKKLFDSIKKNDLETLSALLKQGINLETAKYNGYKPLVFSIKQHCNAFAKYLIEQGANIEQTDDYFWNPLRAAALVGNKEMLKFLIKNGADVNAQNIFGWNALHNAIRPYDLKKDDDLDNVKLLVENGANVNITADSKTPLMLSVSRGNNEILNFLIDNGADVNAQDVNGDTALHNACDYTKGNFAIVESLINADANLNILNKAGQSALYYATKFGYYDIAKLLINCGAEIKSDILLTACDVGGRLRDNTECIKLLIKNGADVNFKNKYNTTPLMIATCGERFETVKLLIEHGADVNVVDDLVQTALDKTELRLAQKSQIEENQKIKDFLIKNGAKTGKELEQQNETYIRKRK